MKSALTHRDVLLGGADAWDKHEKKHLEEHFLPIRQFSDISGEENTFLCGRRGSGKSAIVRMLELQSTFKYTRSIQGEWDEYGDYMNMVSRLTRARDRGADVDIKQAVRRLWLWVLPIVVMQLIVIRTQERNEALDDNILTMKNYLISLPRPLHPGSPIGVVLSNTFKRAYSLLKRGEFDTYLLNLRNSPDFLSAYKALQRTTTAYPALVVFDTMESYRIFQDYMIEGLQGVLGALIAVLADERMHNVAIKFSIPSEIYEEVFAEFPGKVQSRAVFMRWRAADIITMLARRYLSILKRTQVLSPQDLTRLGELVDRAYEGHDGRHLRKGFWYDTRFLPRTVVNRKDGTEDCFAYMLRHTLRRPRDLITAVMQSIVNESVDRNEFPYISPESVRQGVHNPASQEQILGDALSPYEGKFPGKFISNARAAFYKRPVIMTGRELKRFGKELYSVHALPNVDATRFVQMLLQCGVVGLVDGEKPPPGSRALYCKGRFEYLMQGNIALMERERYCVHPIMADVFQMSADPDWGVIYPMPERDLWLEGEAKIL